MLFETLQRHTEALTLSAVPPERQQLLLRLKEQLANTIARHGEVNLNFICTHNSRRSHLSQVWAQVAAYNFGFGRQVRCYSGGTEATALYPAVAETLAGEGLQIDKLSTENNPVYAMKYAADQPAIIGFSKPYHHHFNPAKGFIAVMTCSQADEGCPLVLGADSRVSLTYEDPKLFDESPEKMAKYKERSQQIATEMFWLFNELKKNK